MKLNPILLAAIAMALAAPLSASAETSAGNKALKAHKVQKSQKTQKVHGVSLTSRSGTKAASPAPKETAVKMRTSREPEVIEPVYDYASCGCS